MSDSAANRIDALADTFEAECRAGRVPDVTTFLAEAPEADRLDLRRELLRLELEYRLRAGEAVCVEQCLALHPQLEAEQDTLIDLIVLEYRVRRDCGQSVTIPEYLDRFPRHREQLSSRLGASESRPTVPGYEILSELGRGGMGVVYQARDVQLDRVVALKMILAGSHASEADRSRIRREAEAIARLQHPGIVQVFEVGEQEGRPFIALEFCPEGSLDRLLNTGPMPPLVAAQRVEQVARAIQAAHERGVVHRDLKPANVLMSGGVPKVSDFGLAKRLDTPGQTQSGAILGTPSYMAPEQARGESAITPLADVYALGAILYECLTGRPPFQAATAMDTLMQSMQDEPVEPRRLNAAVPRDVETICLKCLHKEPEKRYTSANALADDLRRFQAGQPIQARPVGRGERAVKWVRRNPVVVSLLTAVAVALLAGTGVSMYFGMVARQEARQAKKYEADAIKTQDLAEQRLRDSLKLIKDWYVDVSKSEELKSTPKGQALRRKFLERARVYYEKIRQETSDSVGVMEELIQSLLDLATIVRELSGPKETLPIVEELVERRRRLLQLEPQSQPRRHRLAAVLGNLAIVHAESGAVDKAVSNIDESNALLTALLAEQGGSEAEVRDQRLQVARNCNTLATALSRAGRDAEVPPYRERAVKDLRILHAQYPHQTDISTTLASTLHNLGIEQGDTKDHELASKTMTEAIKIRTMLTKLDEPGLALDRLIDLENSRHYLGVLLSQMGRKDAARKELLEVVRHMELALEANPQVIFVRTTLANAYRDLAVVETSVGDTSRARGWWEKTLPLHRGIVKVLPNQPRRRSRLSQVLYSLGSQYQKDGRTEDARRLLTEGKAEIQEALKQLPGDRFSKEIEYEIDVALRQLVGGGK